MTPLLNALALLWPALAPSWRFFEEIKPSPRIEFALLASADAEPEDWRAFRPRPAQISIEETLRRLVWNPRWNESLFVVSCAERLLSEPTAHSVEEIAFRLRRDLLAAPETTAGATHFRYRIEIVRRDGAALLRETGYCSEALPLHDRGARA